MGENMRTLSILALSIFCAGGCADFQDRMSNLSAGEARTKSQVPFEEQKSAAANGMLYVYRVANPVGMMVRIPVEVDGQRLGKLNIGAYMFKELPPGTHSIRLKFNMDYSDALAVEIVPGKPAYVEVGSEVRALQPFMKVVNNPGVLQSSKLDFGQ